LLRPMPKLEGKYKKLKKSLAKLGRVVVAYSGGVDSTFLLKVAVDTLGAKNVLACIGVSPSLAKSQSKQAIKNAKDIGATLRTIKLNEMADVKFTTNSPDRCFHCKSHLLRILSGIAKKEKFNYVICGNNFDDEKDYRPGSRAIKLFAARSPLAEAKLTKADIRELSRRMNMPTADMPASPCLASRISYGLEITESRLRQIEQAEDFLRGLGLAEFRVRHHGTIARIEVHPKDFDKISTEPDRSKIVKKLKSLGFKFVTIDLQGFRSGALNEQLSDKEKQKHNK
jgi:pyridinium-3,5-biscarboxylic acid mononucleotide sulfurtransferase